MQARRQSNTATRRGIDARAWFYSQSFHNYPALPPIPASGNSAAGKPGHDEEPGKQNGGGVIPRKSVEVA